LVENPEKQQKLFEELQRYPLDKDQPVTSDILNELRYLKACFKESIRYHNNKLDFSRLFVETTSNSMIKMKPF